MHVMILSVRSIFLAKEMANVKNQADYCVHYTRLLIKSDRLHILYIL